MDEGLHIGCWGRSESGKSTRAKAIIRDEPRVVIFDTLDEYKGVVVHTPAELIRAVMKRPRAFKIIWKVKRGQDKEKSLDELAEVLFRLQEPYKASEGKRHPRLRLYVEEMALCFKNVRRGDTPFNEMCNTGRHYGIYLLGVSQRMAEVSTTFRNTCAVNYFFPPRSSADIDAGADLLAVNEEYDLRAAKSALKRLEVHEYLRLEGRDVQRGRNVLGRNK